MSFPLGGIMRSPSDLDTRLAELRLALETRRAEAVMRLELARASVESRDGEPARRTTPPRERT